MANHGNQMFNYQGHERAASFYANAAVAPAIDKIVEAIRQRPDMCIVPHRLVYVLRQDKQRLKCKTRPIVAFAMGLEIPETGYGTPTCGTSGCVNPAHQVAFPGVERSRADVFNYVQPRNAVAG